MNRKNCTLFFIQAIKTKTRNQIPSLQILVIKMTNNKFYQSHFTNEARLDPIN